MLNRHSNAKLNSFLILAVAAAMLTSASTAGAAIHQLGDSGWSAAVDDEWEISFSIDGYTDKAVIIEIQKRFVGEPDEFGLMPAMYVEFVKDSVEALEQIIITAEYVINNTTENWTDFHIELAVGPDPKAGFCPNCIPSGDQFATVELSSSNGYDGLPTRIDFYDGLVVNGPVSEDVFKPGYASGAMVIITNPELEVGERILLRELPTIPEPATMLVLLAGLAMAMLSVNMKKRRAA